MQFKWNLKVKFFSKILKYQLVLFWLVFIFPVWSNLIAFVNNAVLLWIQPCFGTLYCLQTMSELSCLKIQSNHLITSGCFSECWRLSQAQAESTSHHPPLQSPSSQKLTWPCDVHRWTFIHSSGRLKNSPCSCSLSLLHHWETSRASWWSGHPHLLNVCLTRLDHLHLDWVRPLSLVQKFSLRDFTHSLQHFHDTPHDLWIMIFWYFYRNVRKLQYDAKHLLQ